MVQPCQLALTPATFVDFHLLDSLDTFQSWIHRVLTDYLALSNWRWWKNQNANVCRSKNRFERLEIRLHRNGCFGISYDDYGPGIVHYISKCKQSMIQNSNAIPEKRKRVNVKFNVRFLLNNTNIRFHFQSPSSSSSNPEWCFVYMCGTTP